MGLNQTSVPTPRLFTILRGRITSYPHLLLALLHRNVTLILGVASSEMGLMLILRLPCERFVRQRTSQIRTSLPAQPPPYFPLSRTRQNLPPHPSRPVTLMSRVFHRLHIPHLFIHQRTFPVGGQPCVLHRILRYERGAQVKGTVQLEVLVLLRLELARLRTRSRLDLFTLG